MDMRCQLFRNIYTCITNDIHTINEHNCESKIIKNIEDILKLWSLRKLTLRGTIQVMNTMIISQIMYRATALHMPKKYIDKYKKNTIKFIWDNKPPKVKYKALIANIENGGLKLQDLESKMQ
jgi:hypothetical protein